MPDEDGGRVVAATLWSRHANPLSAWTMVAAYPALVLAIYRRDRPLLVGTLLAVALNPVLVPPARDDTAWSTRVVLGERAWIERGLASSVTDLLFVVACAPVYLFTLRSAAKRQRARTVVGTVVSLVLMVVFFDRMASSYEASTRG